jgi:ligand-binding sensor domain-containing protein/signal transduction histidine kinase
MWFGTRDGINRFDGNVFKVYRLPTSASGLTTGNNLIHTLHIDKSGNLFVGTEEEIFKYDVQTDSFVLLTSTKYFPLDEIVSDNNGNIWFVAGGVLSCYKPSLGRLIHYDRDKFFTASGLSVDETGVLWVSTPDGTLRRYNAEADSFKAFDIFTTSEKMTSGWIETIQCINNGKILIGTIRLGFKIFDSRTGAFVNIPLCCEKLQNLFIRCFVQVSPNEVWIGTETGIFTYDFLTGRSAKIETNSGDKYAISDNVVYTMYKDSEGGIWVGTYFGGVNYYPRQYTAFQKFYHIPFKNSLSGNIVREITQDNSGDFWIATEDEGLNRWNSSSGKFDYYKPGNTSDKIAYRSVHDLLAVDKELWVGTYEHGLDILNIRTGKVIRHYGEGKNGLASTFVFSMLRTRDNEIILGTAYGMYKYSKEKDLFESIAGFPGDSFYTSVLEDSYGTIWTSVPGLGIFYVTKKGESGNFTFSASDSTSLSSNKVNSVFEDGKRDLWVLTENGLNKLAANRRSFQRFTTGDGFPTNFMLEMLEDAKGRLWISTTKGLVCFHPQSKQIEVYTTANGLLSDQFNFGSSYKAKDGRLYFGSAKGMVGFDPDDFRVDSFAPPVYFTGFQIKNQDVPVKDKGSPLTRSISCTKEIHLQYDQATFSIDFSVLGYTAPQNLVYSYRMEGLSNEWINVKGPKKLNFTQLNPGTYLLKLRASSTGGIWNDRTTDLTIEILPPWWRTNLAYLVYCVLLFSFGYFLFMNYHRKIEKRNRRKIELLEIENEKEIIQLQLNKEREVLQLELAKEKEMIESKLDFFTNLAHEIKTPLTLIKAPLNTIRPRVAGMPIVENCIRIMENNTNRLIELTNQILDFRQTEMKRYSLMFERCNITAILLEVGAAFAKVAEQKDATLTVNLPPADFYAHIDKDAFLKILNNLLSNAIKYADSIVQVELIPYHPDGNLYTITFRNDGYLIPDDLKEEIFMPFYRIKETEAKSGTGIGLALARSLALVHNGELYVSKQTGRMNTFCLTLPILTN